MSVRNTVKSIQDIMPQDTGVDGDAQRISQLCWMFFLKIIDDQDQELELLKADYRSPIPKKYQWRAWAADPEGITGEELLAFVNGELFPALKDLTTSMDIVLTNPPFGGREEALMGRDTRRGAGRRRFVIGILSVARGRPGLDDLLAEGQRQRARMVAKLPRA
jgi:type I restriction-modification system DNA methylase subunit